MRGLSRGVVWITFSPDGRLVAALSTDWHVGIWDGTSRRLLHVFEVTPGSHSDNAALAFTQDGNQFGFSAGQEASLWDTKTGEVIKTWRLPKGLTDQMAFPEPGRLLLFRTETESGDVGPFTAFDPRKYPRVCRVRGMSGKSRSNRWSRFGIATFTSFTQHARPMGITMRSRVWEVPWIGQHASPTCMKDPPAKNWESCPLKT